MKQISEIMIRRRKYEIFIGDDIGDRTCVHSLKDALRDLDDFAFVDEIREVSGGHIITFHEDVKVSE